jgi:ketosteroid isomerase-like protein
MKKIFLFAFIAIAAATANAGDIFTRFEGEWRGAGKVNGMDSTLTMKWEPALGGRFWKLSFRNEMRSPQGVFPFEGTAMYQQSKDRKITGSWFDSRGVKFGITSIVDGDALVSEWGSPETEAGKTVYKLTSADSMEVVDSVKGKDGAYKEFGRSLFTRENDLVKIVREFMDVFNAGAAGKMLAFTTDDIEWLSVAGPKINVEAAGQDALKKSLEGYFKGTAIGKSTMETAFQSGNFVTVRERARWKAKDGTDKTQASIAVYEFAGTKIKRVWYYPSTP